MRRNTDAQGICSPFRVVDHDHERNKQVGQVDGGQFVGLGARKPVGASLYEYVCDAHKRGEECVEPVDYHRRVHGPGLFPKKHRTNNEKGQLNE